MWNPFAVEDKGELWPGIVVKHIHFRLPPGRRDNGTTEAEARSAIGRAVVVDRRGCEIKIYPFFDLVNKSFNPDVGCSPQPSINLGATVQDFIEGSRSESAAGGPYARDVRRCVFASNTLHTNFVRPNGFVVADGRLIYKPEYAVGLDCSKYMPLHGEYTALVSERGQLSVKKTRIENNQLLGDPNWAISGPQLVSQRESVDMGEFPRNPQGRKCTIGDEVSYDPIATKTSFTAFGIDDDDRIVFVSMFEKLRGLGSGCNLGINVAEMILLFITELSVKEAILGGGGADTQQFVRGDHPEFMIAPVRARGPEEGPRPEVVGPRGLGAIVGVLLKAK